MNTSRTTHHPLQTILFGLAVALPLGCDPSEGPEPEGLELQAAALELSPSQDLVELDEAEAVAFDAVDSFDLEADVQAFGAGCTLLRPAGWHGVGVSCVEYYKAPGSPPDLLSMSDGQSFITHSGYSGPGIGTGSARISCDDGVISIQAISCVGGGGGVIE